MAGTTTRGGIDAVIERQVSIDRVPYFIGGIVVVILAFIALMVFGEAIPAGVTVLVLGVLAACGAAALLCYIFGVLQFGGRSTGQAVSEMLLRDTDAGVMVARRDGEVLFANRRYASLVGGGDSTAVSTPDLTLEATGDSSSALARLGEAASRGDRATEEVRTQDGRWLRVATRPAELSASQRDLVAWEVEDVTGGRREQEAAFVAAQDAVDYLDAAPVGVAAVRPDGVLMHVNATLAGWLGLDLTAFQRAELRLGDYIAGEGAMALAAARPGVDGVARVDLDLRAATGETRPARLLDVNRADGSHLLVAVDREASGTAEHGGAAEARFNRFFFDAPVALAALDRNGRVTRANAAFARLVDRTDVAGETLPDLLPGGDAAALEREVTTLARGGEGSGESVDVALPTEKRGESRYLRFHAATTDAAEGEDAVIVYAMDNTERKGIEAAYVQSQKMEAVGELAGGMAHDLNNMLSIILGYADELLQNHPADDPSNAALRSIKTATNQSAALVKHLLAYSRQQTMQPQIFDVSDVLSDTDMLLRKLAKNATLRVEPGSGLWPVKADPFHINQVLSNLVKNADEATPKGGTVTIAARNVAEAEAATMPDRGLVPGDYVMIEVTDTGHGMDAETRARVFDPFFTTKAVNKGTGLGLAMVYGTIKQSRGYIFVDSELGEGTRFRILLPRHEATAEELAKAEAEAERKRNRPKRDITGSGTILLVEDETMLRATSLSGLRKKGYIVHEAMDGEEALEVLEELDGAVDLIVSDVVMPEMNGPTLLGEVRRIYGDRHAFMFVSGHAEDAFRKDLPEDAEFSFLAKPYELAVLAASVKDALGR